MQTAEKFHSAAANAINFFEDCREPLALLWLDVMHRRFGTQQFATALQRFDRVLTEQPKELARLRVFRRMADYNNPLQPEDWEALTQPSDRLLVSALYCDRLGLPASFADWLDKAAKLGGYYLPHVLLTLVWVKENGVELALPDGFIDDIYAANAAICNNNPMEVSDLKLEAGAFLCLAGQGPMVDARFIESIVLAQNDDGGWGPRDAQGNSDWHASILGLLLLLHLDTRQN